MTDREIMKLALEALERLYDEQDDAPIESRRFDWEMAMAMSREAMDELCTALGKEKNRD